MNSRRSFLKQTVGAVAASAFLPPIGKCDYCSRYSPLGSCEGCGAPNTPQDPPPLDPAAQYEFVCSGPYITPFATGMYHQDADRLLIAGRYRP